MWCYLGFKEQGGDKEFIYCVLCKTKLKYCSVLLDQLLGREDGSFAVIPARLQRTLHNTNIVLYTLGFAVYIFEMIMIFTQRLARLHVGFDE